MLASATPSPSTQSGVAVGPASCENGPDGYTIEVPEGWWYSPSCAFLDPASFEMGPLEPSRRPAITIVKVVGDVGTFETVLDRRGLIVAGRPAARWEVDITSEGGLHPVGTRVYQYVVQLGASEEAGPNLVLQTDSLVAPAYEAAKARLDEIARSLQLRPR